MITAGILLAAGRSTRFGRADKLLADLAGQPLVSYAAAALTAFGPDLRIAVISDPDVAAALPGFLCVAPDCADPAQSDSLRAGIAKARALGADRALIALGDMPYVTAGQLRGVCAACTDNTPAATAQGARRLPPACFPRVHFADLLASQGDQGARALLRDLPEHALVAAPARAATDIDTETDLAAARADPPPPPAPFA